MTDEASPSYVPVSARTITSTTFTIAQLHPDYADVDLEFGVGDSVRCRLARIRGPEEATPRQRMVAVERIG